MRQRVNEPRTVHRRLKAASIEPEHPSFGCCKSGEPAFECDVCNTPSCLRCLSGPKQTKAGVFACPRCVVAETPDTECKICQSIDQRAEKELAVSRLRVCRSSGGWECHEKALKLLHYEKTNK